MKSVVITYMGRYFYSWMGYFKWYYIILLLLQHIYYRNIHEKLKQSLTDRDQCQDNLQSDTYTTRLFSKMISLNKKQPNG